jgi:hypothetical protein
MSVPFPDNHAGLAEVLGLSELVLIPAEGGLATNWAPCRGHGPLGLRFIGSLS